MVRISGSWIGEMIGRRILSGLGLVSAEGVLYYPKRFVREWAEGGWESDTRVSIARRATIG